MSTDSAPSWQERASQRRSELSAKIPSEWLFPESILAKISQDSNENVLAIPRECGLLTTKEITITEDYDAIALLNKLATGELTSLEVTTSFCKRAAIAQQLTCCLTETFFDEAIQRAKSLDEQLASTKKPVGPLHGLPISVKDSFNIKGVPTTLGLISFMDHKLATINSPLITILLDAGAVLYVKTNIPQTLMTADSQNNLFGRTLNPNKLSLTAGGSSGGEGALVALRGSPLGIGTDIAGSIRIPALCCGDIGFKPSVGRVPYSGQTSCHRAGIPGIIPCAGPICHSVDDAQLLLKTIFNANVQDLDESAIAKPWTEPRLRPSTLRIGVITEDPTVPLLPPMLKTITSATTKLKQAGHTIIPLDGEMPNMKSANDTAFTLFNMDPERTVFKHIAASGEPEIPSLVVTYPPDKRDFVPTLDILYGLTLERVQVKAAMRRVWTALDLDLILCPAYQGCAPTHDNYGSAIYTVFWNLVDYPACVLPFEWAEKVIDKDFVRDVLYTPAYEPDAVEGAPCHVQLVGRNLQDEELLQNVAVIEKTLKS